MHVNVDIDIEKARKALTLSAGSIEEAKIYENCTDEEIKDKVLSHCKCWGMTEYKNSNNGSSDDVELLDIVRAATRYMQGKSIEDLVDDNGEKHKVNEKDLEAVSKIWNYYNKVCELKEKAKQQKENDEEFNFLKAFWLDM